MLLEGLKRPVSIEDSGGQLNGRARLVHGSVNKGDVAQWDPLFRPILRCRAQPEVVVVTSLVVVVVSAPK